MVAEDPLIGQGLAGGLATAAVVAGGHIELDVLDFMPIEDGFSEAAVRGPFPASHLPAPESAGGTRALASRGGEPARGVRLRGRRDPVRPERIRRSPRFRHRPRRLEPQSGRRCTSSRSARGTSSRGAHAAVGRSRQTLDVQLPRDVLRCFGMRAVGQMDDESSVVLIDSPIAASLRPTQALLYDEPRCDSCASAPTRSRIRSGWGRSLAPLRFAAAVTEVTRRVWWRALPRDRGVRWLGHRDDIADVFADLDAFVLPSTRPSRSGSVLVEALASGVPVVAPTPGGPGDRRPRPGAYDSSVRAGRAAGRRGRRRPARRVAGVDRGPRARRSQWPVPPPDYAALFREVAVRSRQR